MYIGLGVESAYERRAALKYGPKGGDHGVAGKGLNFCNRSKRDLTTAKLNKRRHDMRLGESFHLRPSA